MQKTNKKTIYELNSTSIISLIYKAIDATQILSKVRANPIVPKL